jgi:hypothetical protein
MTQVDPWLRAAERIDALRLIPRAALLGYSFFSMWYIVWAVGWYMGLPAVERTATETAFISSTITAILGGGTWYASSYNASGRKWDGQSNSG